MIRRTLLSLLGILVGAAALSQPAGAFSPTRASVLVDDAVGRAGVRARTSVLRMVVVERDRGGKVAVRRTDVMSEEAAERTVEAADERGDVLSVEIDGRASVAAVATDPGRPQQWALDGTTFEKAWPTTTGNGIVVAVVDSGVRADHEDLQGAVLSGATFLSGNGTGTLGPTNDQNGHGTHVAGIVAARASNGLGVAGGAPSAKVLPVRVLDAAGSGWWSDIASGIIWATDRGAKVINLSLGSNEPSSTILSAVRYAKGRDVVVVAASGNDGNEGSPASWPAAYTEVLAVAAVQKGNGHAAFSTIGSYVDLSAPGAGVLSLGMSTSGSYVTMSGTSMAAPYVSAAAALVRAAKPAATADQVRAALEGTARDLGATGTDPVFGRGLVDPAAAIGAAPAPAPVVQPPTVVPGPVAPK